MSLLQCSDGRIVPFAVAVHQRRTGTSVASVAVVVAYRYATADTGTCVVQAGQTSERLTWYAKRVPWGSKAEASRPRNRI